jgi:hypothetical protein
MSVHMAEDKEYVVPDANHMQDMSIDSRNGLSSRAKPSLMGTPAMYAFNIWMLGIHKE